MGYESTRFVDAKEKDLNNLLCMLCTDVYAVPVTTVCCKQTFCDSCIKKWIEMNRTCPYDNQPLKVESLISPPKALMNLLSKLKIKCKNVVKGCPEVTSVENIENHQNHCVFDKETCRTCGFVAQGEHNCVSSLLEYKNNINNIMNQLRQELDETQNQNRNLRSQIDNYMRTIQDLTKDKVMGKPPPTKSGIILSNKEMLIEARKFIDTAVVDLHRTKREIADNVVEMIKEAITIKGDRIYDVTKFMKEYMDTNYLGDWNCYILYNNIGFVFHNVSPEAFVEVKFGKVVVTIYKTFDVFGFNRMVSYVRANATKNFQVSKTGFDETATSEIEKMVIGILKATNDMNQFTERITTDLTTNYGGIWHCFLYKANFGFYCIRSGQGQYVLFSAADVKILIFQ